MNTKVQDELDAWSDDDADEFNIVITPPEDVDEMTDNEDSGTVRDNRTSRASLCDVKAMKKTDRGSYDTVFDNNNNIIAVRWNDNAINISEIFFIVYIGRPF